jgi:hypothetical protein
MALVALSTRWGAFLSDDSYYYIQPARDALSGRGFSPSPIFGPFLPASLTALGWLGLDPIDGIRLLNIGLFGASIALVALILRQLGVMPGFALLGALLIALSDNTIEAYSWAMSEALGITFSLFALLLALRYMKLRTWPWLLGSALAVAVAVLSRFAALPVAAAIGLWLLIWPRDESLFRRARQAAIFALLSLAPFGVYVLRTRLMLGRPFYYAEYISNTPFTLKNLVWYLYNSLSWFIPGRLLRDREIPIAVGLGLALAAAAAAVYLIVRRNRPGGTAKFFIPGIALLLLFILFNYLMLYFGRGLTNLAIYNPRYLVPPLTIGLLGVVFLLDRLWRLGPRWAGALILAALIGFLVYYGVRAADFTRLVNEEGLGYSSRGWHSSETVAYLKQNPTLELVVTGDKGIYFWTGRLPRGISSFLSPADVRAHLCATSGELVIIKSMPPGLYRMEKDALIDGLELKHDFSDGEIYRCPSG